MGMGRGTNMQVESETMERNSDYSIQGASVERLAEICRERLLENSTKKYPVLHFTGMSEHQARALTSPLIVSKYSIAPANNRYCEGHREANGTYSVDLCLVGGKNA